MTGEKKERKAAWANLATLLRPLLEGIEMGEPSEVYAELSRSWLGIALSENVPESFWGEIVRIAENSYWKTIEANLEFGDEAFPPDVLSALETAKRFVVFLERIAGLLGYELPEEEAPAAEEGRPEVEEVEKPARTPLRALGLSNRVYNALMKRDGLDEALQLDRAPCVEDVLQVLEDESRGERFLLLGVRNFGPEALIELKEKLREHKFLPAEEEEPNTEWGTYDEAVY